MSTQRHLAMLLIYAMSFMGVVFYMLLLAHHLAMKFNLAS